MTDTAGLARCVLVDNNPMSFISNPSNGIPVPVRTTTTFCAETAHNAHYVCVYPVVSLVRAFWTE
eukprot:COSAG02_NODE_682_length_18523_cov_28.592271_2_plen_65_part_00